MKITSLIVVSLGILILTGCSSSRDSITSIEYPHTLREARQALQDRNYKKVESSINSYLTKAKDIYWNGHAYLLLGESREASGQSEKAIEAYKKALNQATGYDDKVAIAALYRISWIYEKDRKFKDLIIVLKDLRNNLADGDEFIRDIETPSRMANAYYIENLWDKAVEERNSVDLKTVAGSLQGSTPEALLRARLYRALAVYGENKDISVDLVLPLVQKEILDVGESAEVAVAEKGFQHLKTLYSTKWKTLNQKKKFPKIEEQMNFNKGQLDQLAAFMDLIQDLKSSRRPPDTISNKVLNTDFFKFLDDLEKDVRARAQSMEMGVQKWKKK